MEAMLPYSVRVARLWRKAGWWDRHVAAQVVQDARTVGVNDVEVERGSVPSLRIGERVQGRGEHGHRAWHPPVEPEVESRRLELVGDPVLGVGHQMAGVVHQTHPCAATVAAHNCDGDRIAEQPVRQQRAHIIVLWPVAQRAELARHDQHVGAGVGAAEVVCPVDRCAAGRAAELGDGEPACFLAKPQLADHPAGEGRHREAGARDKHHGVDVPRTHLGRGQSPPDHRGDPLFGLAGV
jgi:hypothetical protein